MSGGMWARGRGGARVEAGRRAGGWFRLDG